MRLRNGESIAFKPLLNALLVGQQSAIPDIGIISVASVDLLEYRVCNAFDIDIGILRESFLLGAPDILSDSLAIHSCRSRNRTDVVASSLPSQNIYHLNHGVLLV